MVVVTCKTLAPFMISVIYGLHKDVHPYREFRCDPTSSMISGITGVDPYKNCYYNVI